jgi:nitrile hydratase
MMRTQKTHDMGGVSGFGPINAESEHKEPLFHAPWESRVLAITVATGMLGRWTLDRSRHARERQPREQYLANSYYENWIAGLETLLVESGLLTPQELKSGKAQGKTPLAINKDHALKILQTGGPTLMDEPLMPTFHIGQKVRVKDEQFPGHTRVPAYAQGCVGVVEAYRGVHVFADANAPGPEQGGERRGEPLYTVCFQASELWGAEANKKDTVCIDLWQPYLKVP